MSRTPHPAEPDWVWRNRVEESRVPKETPNAFWRDQTKRIAEVMADICKHVGVTPMDSGSILSMAIALGEEIERLRARRPHEERTEP